MADLPKADMTLRDPMTSGAYGTYEAQPSFLAQFTDSLNKISKSLDVSQEPPKEKPYTFAPLIIGSVALIGIAYILFKKI